MLFFKEIASLHSQRQSVCRHSRADKKAGIQFYRRILLKKQPVPDQKPDDPIRAIESSATMIKVGIIGAGGIAQVSHIPNLMMEPSARLVAICDSDSRRAALVAERFGLSTGKGSVHGGWYDEPEMMLKNEPLDCVIISTPTISHLPMCQLAFEHGVDVMVEKPFARNAAEARRIVEISEETGQLLMVAMNHRFRDDTLRLKELLDLETLGELSSVHSGWLKRLGVWTRPHWFTDRKLAGGGVLLDLGLQMIDLILYLLNFPQVVEVSCGISDKVLELDVEDTASVFIRFDDGVTFLLAVSWANYDTEDIAYTYFSGEEGGASLNPLRVTRRQRDRVISLREPGLEDGVALYRHSFQRELSHFIKSVQQRTQLEPAEPDHPNHPALSSGRQAIAVMDVIDRLYQSAGR